VDAERSFSKRRLAVNHLQHKTSSQTFRAKVALGSWIGTPLWPGISDVTKILEPKLPSKTKGKVKEVEIMDVDDS